MFPDDLLQFDTLKVQMATSAKCKHPLARVCPLLLFFALVVFVLDPYNLINLIPTMNECLIRFDSTFIIINFYKKYQVELNIINVNLFLVYPFIFIPIILFLWLFFFFFAFFFAFT